MSEAWSEIHTTIAAFAGSYWATLGIAGVGAYLGLFTVLRRIVFTGVALAQLAAAGVAAAFWIAERPGLPLRTAEFLHRHGPTIGSLSFSLLGMLGLESRSARRRLSPDALVGLAYAAASALAILLVWRSAVGLVELRNILAGEVLLSSDRELLSLWIGLILVVLLHLAHRRAFLLVSYDPDFARAQGHDERHYQWLLMGSLAVAVALALKTAGLLLVFAVLVLPALGGLALGRTLAEAGRLAIASGLFATLAGFALSVRADWPVAPSISLVLLVLLGLCAIGARQAALGAAVRGLLLVGALASLGVGLSVFSPRGVLEATFGASDEPIGHVHAPAPSADQQALDAAVQKLSTGASAEERAEGARTLVELGAEAQLGVLLDAFAEDEEIVQQAALEALRAIVQDAHARARLEQFATSGDPELALFASRALIRLGNAQGIWAAIQLLRNDELAVFSREELILALHAISGDALGYDEFGDAAENEAAIAAWDEWWRQSRERLDFDETEGWSLSRD